jgi:uncharacterized protein (DUF1778 family)
MPRARKDDQLQIRVSPEQKRAIKRQADRAGMSMSEWILHKLLPSAEATFQGLVAGIASAAPEERGYAFAELLDWIDSVAAAEFEAGVGEPPEAELDPYWANYVAATVEQAAALKHVKVPSWTRDVPPLDRPVFGSSLKSLRLHLLVNAPAAFARRNIFIDSAVGRRV